MNNRHTQIGRVLGRQLCRLPFIHSEAQGHDLLRIALLFFASQVVFLIVFHELHWFTEFGVALDGVALGTWTLWVTFLTLYYLVCLIQGMSYLGLYRYPYYRMHRHWLVAPAVVALYAMAVMLAAIANSEGVDAAHILLPLVVLSPLVQIFSIFFGALIALASTIIAAMFYPDFAPISVAYLVLQQIVLMVMVRSFVGEHYAREDVQRRNDELRATQTLLGEASRQNERLRIARNIHDLVGHHVTALSLNLEALAYKADGELRDDILAVQEIAKALLLKVRQAVSEYRMDTVMPVRDILAELTCHAPSLTIELDVDDKLLIRDAAVAELILRACQEVITNTLKHSSASSLFIQLHEHRGQLRLTAIDDGQGSGQLQLGNGLLGMRERVEALHGQLSLGNGPAGGFKLSFSIPLNGGEL